MTLYTGLTVYLVLDFLGELLFPRIIFLILAQFLLPEFQVPVEPGQGDPDGRVREDDELLPVAPPPLGCPHQVQVQGGGLQRSREERTLVPRIRLLHAQ